MSDPEEKWLINENDVETIASIERVRNMIF